MAAGIHTGFSGLIGARTRGWSEAGRRVRFPRLRRPGGLLAGLLALTAFGLTGDAAQPPSRANTAPPPAVERFPRPLGLSDLGGLPLQRVTPAEQEAYQQQVRRAAEFGARAPVPPPVAPQFVNLTTNPRPPQIGPSTRCFEKQPMWAWDQQFIYFASNNVDPVASYGATQPPVGARNHLYRITSDGAFITQLTGLAGTELIQDQTYPSVNHALTKLVYVAPNQTGDGSLQLWLLDLITLTRTQMTGLTATTIPAAPPNNALNGLIRQVQRPSWSPADNVIVFSAVESTPGSSRNIYRIEPNARVVTRVTNSPANSGVECIDPVYDTLPGGGDANPGVAFAANTTGVNGGTGDLFYVPTPLVDLRNDGSANDVNHNIFVVHENGPSVGTPMRQVTTSIADDIEPTYSTIPGASYNGFLAWASLGRTANAVTGTTYDIFYNNGNLETGGGATTPIRVFTPDTNAGAVPLNQTDERYPTFSAGLPPSAAKPVRAVVFSSNRTQIVVGSTASIGVGNVLTESDLWRADLEDITPPTLQQFNPQQLPGEILHIANQPLGEMPPGSGVLTNFGSRIGVAGETFYFYARVLDGQAGVESVWVQIKDPDGPSTDAAAVNHRLYGTNAPFVIHRDGNGAATRAMSLSWETDFQGLGVSDYAYFDSGPVSDTALLPPFGLAASYASYIPGVSDATAWSGSANRPPLDGGMQPRWLQLHDDGVFPDLQAGDNVYSSSWVTPNTPSDYYVDLIAYDKAVNPQVPAAQQNWIIYDNIWGFSTQPFVSQRPILYVDDNGAGQGWPRGLKGSFRPFPTFRLGHESEVIDRPPGFRPTLTAAPPFGTVAGGGPHHFLTNLVGTITYARPPSTTATLRAYNYDFWRILAKGPLPETVLNDYVPVKDEQPRRGPGGTFTTVQQAVPRRAVVWNAPYTGDIMAGGGTILDQAVQTLLTTYRSRGGRLYVAGGDILWALNLGNTGAVISNFARTVLGAQTFTADAGPNTQAFVSNTISLAITRDVFNIFVTGFAGPPFWNDFNDIDPIGVNDVYLDGNHNSNPVREACADGLPFQANDTFTAMPGWAQVFTNTMVAQDDEPTQSKTVFFSASLASLGRYYRVENDNLDSAVHCMEYRAKHSHATFCWMFSVDLTGQVVNLNQGGAPISGALVEAFLGGTVVGAAFTRADGTYTIRGLPVGNWGLRASAPGFVTFAKATGNQAHGLGAVSEDFLLTEAPPGSISGRVDDQDGQPIAGTTIKAELQAGPLYTGQRNFFGTTQSDGTYLINNVPAGDVTTPAVYVVTVDAVPPLFDLASANPASRNVNVLSAQDSPNNDFVVNGLPGPLTVHVFEDINGNKGPALANCEVTLLDAANNPLPGYIGTTDATGSVVFDDPPAGIVGRVPPGPNVVNAFKIGYQERNVSVNIPQQNSVEVLLPIAVIRPLYGLVRRGADNLPLAAADLDTAVPLHLLRRISRLPIPPPVNVEGTTTPIPMGPMGAVSNYVFAQGQDGDYTVAFTDQNHPRFFPGEVNVTITSNTPNIAPDLVLLGRPGSVVGFVKEDTMGNPPIPGATVTFTPQVGAPTSVSSAADGSFSSGTLPSDVYTVTVTKFGYTSPAPQQVFVAGNRNLGDILMTPSPRGEVFGLVRRTPDNLPRDVTVRFTPQGAPTEFFDVLSSTSLTPAPAPDPGNKNYTTTENTTQGMASVVNLPQGTYTISVLPDPRFSAFQVVGGNQVVVAGNDKQRKDINLTPAAGTLTATVRDGNTNAVVSGATVVVRNGANQVVANTTTGGGGQFTTGSIPGGPYTVTITHPNYENGVFNLFVEGPTNAGDLFLTPKPPSHVTGIIRSNVDNTLVDGVLVELLNTNGQPVVPAVTTTSAGALSGSPARNYDLFPVPAGNWIIRVSKGGWRTQTQSVTVLPGVDKHNVNFQLAPDHVFGAGLLLISFPYDFGGLDAVDILNLDTGASPRPERTAYWITQQNRYAIFPNEPEARFFTLGKGMFVRLLSKRAFTTPGTPAPNAPFSIALKTGWNMIGSVRNQRIDWLRVKVVTGQGTFSMQQALSQGILQNGLFAYVDGYFNAQALDPFQGYFVRAFQDCSIVIPVDNTSVQVTPTDRRKVASLPVPPVEQIAREIAAAGLGPDAARRGPALPSRTVISSPRRSRGEPDNPFGTNPFEHWAWLRRRSG